MKRGGVSWNRNVNSKRGVVAIFKCKYCSRAYKMEWAKNNHEKLCRGKEDENNNFNDE